MCRRSTHFLASVGCIYLWHMQFFYHATLCYSAVYAMALCPSIRLSVCSHLSRRHEVGTASHIRPSPNQSYFMWWRRLEIEWTVNVICNVKHMTRRTKVLFCSGRPMCSLNLKLFAKTVLTRNASSVAVKCIFSTTGLILNGKRSKLSGDKANAISFRGYAALSMTTLHFSIWSIAC